jgi:hypothetical protein
MTELTNKTKTVLKNLDSNINKMRSEAAYLKEVSMQQDSGAMFRDLEDSPHRVLDYRPSPRVFLSTGEIKELRETLSVAELESIEAEYAAKRVDPVTAREQYYDQFKADMLAKSLGQSPIAEVERSDEHGDDESSDMGSEFPLPLWKAPRVKTPPVKSKTTIPQPFSFDVKEKPGRKPKEPSIRQTKVALMVAEKLAKDIEDSKY